MTPQNPTLTPCLGGVSRFRVASRAALGFVQEGTLTIDTGNPSHVALGYLGTNPSRLGLLIGNGNRTTRFSQWGPLGNVLLDQLDVFGTITAVKLADLNNDGSPDIITLNRPKTMQVTLNGQATRTFNLPEEATDLAVGDLNNDGKLDIVVTVKSNFNQIYLNDGNGGLRTPSALGNADRRAIALGDLNNDGNLDWVVITRSTVALTWLDGNLRIIGSKVVFANSANAVALADINQDGRLDIIIASSVVLNPIQLSVLLNLGNGNFSSPMQYTGPSASVRNLSVKAADMNGDGTMDVVMLTDDTLSVFLGRNDGTLRQRTDFNLPNSPLSFDIGDLNNNGTLDVVTGNTSSVSWYSSSAFLPRNAQLNPSIAFLPLSSSRTFSITDTQGNPIRPFEPSTSSDTNIATISPDAVQTTSTAGTATITAYTDGPSSQVISSSNPLLGALDLTTNGARVSIPNDASLNLQRIKLSLI
jgi:hypothetical protein